MSFSVYVAASFQDGERVRACHSELERHGLRPTSTWLELAKGEPEALDKMPKEDVFRAIEENDAQIRKSDAVLVLASVSAKETFCEARYACELGRLVLWVGEPRPLSAYRKNVRQFDSVELALAFLAGSAAYARQRRAPLLP